MEYPRHVCTPYSSSGGEGTLCVTMGSRFSKAASNATPNTGHTAIQANESAARVIPTSIEPRRIVFAEDDDEPGPPPPPEKETTATELESAALLIESLCGVIGSRVTNAGTELSAAIESLLLALARSHREGTSALRRLQNHRCDWLEKQVEELDAVEKLLHASTRLCDADDSLDVSLLMQSLTEVIPIVNCDVFPRQCLLFAASEDALVTVPSYLRGLTSVTRVQTGPNARRCLPDGRGARYYDPSAAAEDTVAQPANTFKLTVLDDYGADIRGLRPQDFTLALQQHGVSIPLDTTISVRSSADVVVMYSVLGEVTAKFCEMDLLLYGSPIVSTTLRVSVLLPCQKMYFE